MCIEKSLLQCREGIGQITKPSTLAYVLINRCLKILHHFSPVVYHCPSKYQKFGMVVEFGCKTSPD